MRKQAPKRVGGSHPSFYWLMSMGVDSVAAYLLTRRALHENYGKRPIMVYLDTRIGLPFNRLYAEALADYYDEQLWTLRTHEKFEDRMAARGKFEDRDDAGAPSGALHSDVQNELKGRQRELLAGRDDEAIYVTGIRAQESDERAAHPKGEIDDGIRYVKPVYELTKTECAEIILRADAPINPGWWWRHPTDCACHANGEPGEMDAIEERFPTFAQRLREYEEAAQLALDDRIRWMLGWGGLTAEEQRARKQGQKQLSLCRGGCQRKVPTPIESAFKARVLGASIERSVSMLYDTQPGVVA